MIRHTPHTMSIRQYALFEETKDIRLFFRVWVPMWVALRYSGRFVDQFNGLFNAKKEEDNERLVYKLMAQNRIMLLQALMMAIQVHLGEKIQLDMMRPDNKNRVTEDPKLAFYIAQVEEVTGIKIMTLEDITAFRNELERKIDKYNEMFPVEEKKEGITMLQLAFSVFGLMNMAFDSEMKLSEFAVLKQMADGKAKQMRAEIDKYKE